MLTFNKSSNIRLPHTAKIINSNKCILYVDQNHMVLYILPHFCFNFKLNTKAIHWINMKSLYENIGRWTAQINRNSNTLKKSNGNYFSVVIWHISWYDFTNSPLNGFQGNETRFSAHFLYLGLTLGVSTYQLAAHLQRFPG